MLSCALGLHVTTRFRILLFNMRNSRTHDAIVSHSLLVNACPPAPTPRYQTLSIAETIYAYMHVFVHIVLCATSGPFWELVSYGLNV